MSLEADLHQMFRAQADKIVAARQPTPAEVAVHKNHAGGESLRLLFEVADQEAPRPAAPATGTTPDGFNADVARALGITN